ncbi:hypothetical protein PS2_036959 [Malus domestica]
MMVNPNSQDLDAGQVGHARKTETERNELMRLVVLALTQLASAGASGKSLTTSSEAVEPPAVDRMMGTPACTRVVAWSVMATALEAFDEVDLWAQREVDFHLGLVLVHGEVVGCCLEFDKLPYKFSPNKRICPDLLHRLDLGLISSILA